ncbi:MAG: hypothetical protein K8S94_08360 [Planctomycetia bacterium]|nr:hypothetical protein [Planctomycetia bacterium]
MIYSFVSDPESVHGIKAGCQLAAAFAACGVRCVMVTPDGTAPDWVGSSAPFAAESLVLPRISAADTVIFSTPRDRERLARLPARLVFHAQHAAATIDPLFADPSITVLTCWPEAAAIRPQRERESIDVGIAVADVFFHAGLRKLAGTVAILPSDGAARVAECAAALPHLSVAPIVCRDDRGSAAILHTSEFAVAAAEGAGCELAVLEALAAGCVVISEPSPTAAALVHDGVNGIVAARHDLCDVLREWSAPAARIRRAALCDRGRATAAAHRPAGLRRRIAHLLAGPLAFLRS